MAGKGPDDVRGRILSEGRRQKPFTFHQMRGIWVGWIQNGGCVLSGCENERRAATIVSQPWSGGRVSE